MVLRGYHMRYLSMGMDGEKYLKKNRYLPGKPKYFITIVYMSIKKK